MEKVSVQFSVVKALKRLGYNYVRLSDTGILTYLYLAEPYSWEIRDSLTYSCVDKYGYFDLNFDVLYFIDL